MSLLEKTLRLKLDAALASRTAAFWDKQIAVHGEHKATEFYKSLGLNHLQKKSIEWEGLTLSREPRESEKLCVKGVAAAQDAGKESVTRVLLALRSDVITDALKAIKKLKPADYHSLVLDAPARLITKLRDELDAVFERGRSLVATELGKPKKDVKKADPIDDDELLDELTELTTSRVLNDVQSRITAATARYRLLGLEGSELWKAVEEEVAAGSVSYIDRSAVGAVNRVLSFGRMQEMVSRQDDIGRYEYSALLDQNTCGPCAADDGKEASNPNDLPDTPNPECEGSDYCRCFTIAILDTVA